MHCAAGVTATESSMPTAEARVSTAETRMAATTAVASSAVLRPHGHREEDRERRDGHQATHTEAIISPIFQDGGGFTNSDENARTADWRANLLLALSFFRGRLFGWFCSRF